MRRILAFFGSPFMVVVRLIRLFRYGTEPAAGPAPAEGTAAPVPGTTLSADAPEDGTFIDMERGRSVPYRLWAPGNAGGPAPVVVFSHGLGGSRSAAPYLGRALAEAGYWGLFIQHQGSDERVVEGIEGREAVAEALLESVADPANMLDRFLDLPFVLDEVERLNAEPGPYRGRFDLDRIGMAGHSYGARSVLTAAGQLVGRMGAEFADPRVIAGLALSPTAGRELGDEEIVPASDYALIEIPILHVTGTEDRPPLVDDAFDPYVRTLPFQQIPAADQYLLVLAGAKHEDFSGTTRDGAPARDTRYTVIVAEVAVLFFDAYLKGSETAWYNLRNRLSEHLDPDDYYEFR